MSLTFVTASSQYLENTSTPPVGFTGCSMCCWAQRDTDAVEMALIAIGINNTAGTYVGLHINSDGRSRAYSYASGSSASATAGTSGGALNTWNFYGGTFTSSTQRNAYWNTATASNSTSNTPSGTLTGMAIGRRMGTTRLYLGGKIAYITVWDTVLTAAEMAVMGSAFAPRMVRPENCRVYIPCIDGSSPAIDQRGGFNMTLNASPTYSSDNPRIIQPFAL